MPTVAPRASSAAGALLLAVSFAALAPSATAQSAQLTRFGSNVGDALGRSLAPAGDVDGDGVPDFIVGAPAAFGSASAPGYALVLSGADGSTIHLLRTSGEPDLFGWSVAGVGDTDGDDVPDLLVGEPGSVPGTGEARLFSGQTGHMLHEINSGPTDSWDGFGFAVAGLGDIDGDERTEYVIGQPSLSGEEVGRARVYGGLADGLMYTLTGLSTGDGFGSALASLSDIDGDDVRDLVVGAPGGGYARVFSGATGALLHHFPGFAADYGRSVSGAGDIDGDGTEDIAIGAPAFDSVDVMSGATGELLRRFETLGGSFGASLAPLGDVDGDDVPDLLIGSPDDTLLEVEGCGSALVVSGETGAHLYKFFGDEANEHAGTAVASLGDSDADGLPELLLGTPGEHVAAVGAAGSAKLYSGALAASVETYGFGCPNSFLITPVLELLGDPVPSGHVILSLTRLNPASVAVVFIGGGPGFAPLSNGCILWVAPVLPTTLVFPLGRFPDSADTVTLSGRLPPSTPAGLVVTFQAFVVDAFLDSGFASSSAVQLTVQ